MKILKIDSQLYIIFLLKVEASDIRLGNPIQHII